MRDRCGRTIEYVRISVTDRCNLRCRYCMPASGGCFAPDERLLTFDEIERTTAALARLGIRRVRLTGGEPLCRPGLDRLAGRLAALEGIDEVALTTNGLLLAAQAEALYAAGVRRVNLSLDSLRPDRYAAITRGGDLAQALAGLEAAQRVGMKVKLNMVPMRAVNDDEILDFLAFGRAHGTPVRFIELMPVGLGESREGVPGDEVLAAVRAALGEPAPFRDTSGGGPAVCYAAGGSVFGLISAVHHRFCASCNRVRLTADGVLRPCLAYEDGLSLLPWLREGKDGLEDALRQAIYEKPDGHRFEAGGPAGRTMNRIGG